MSKTKFYVDADGNYLGGSDGKALSEFEVSHAPDDARQHWNGSSYDPIQLSYVEQRKISYPSIQDQLDMQYWDSINNTTNWIDLVSSIKNRSPKP